MRVKTVSGQAKLVLLSSGCAMADDGCGLKMSSLTRGGPSSNAQRDVVEQSRASEVSCRRKRMGLSVNGNEMDWTGRGQRTGVELKAENGVQARTASGGRGEGAERNGRRFGACGMVERDKGRGDGWIVVKLELKKKKKTMNTTGKG